MFGLFKKKTMTEEVVNSMSNLVTSAFALVAALAWNDAIQGLFDMFFGKEKSVMVQVIYAVAVTIIAVVAAVWIGRVANTIAKLKL